MALAKSSPGAGGRPSSIRMETSSSHPTTSAAAGWWTRLMYFAARRQSVEHNLVVLRQGEADERRFGAAPNWWTDGNDRKPLSPDDFEDLFELDAQAPLDSSRVRVDGDRFVRASKISKRCP